RSIRTLNPLMRRRSASVAVVRTNRSSPSRISSRSSPSASRRWSSAWLDTVMRAITGGSEEGWALASTLNTTPSIRTAEASARKKTSYRVIETVGRSNYATAGGREPGAPSLPSDSAHQQLARHLAAHRPDLVLRDALGHQAGDQHGIAVRLRRVARLSEI